MTERTEIDGVIVEYKKVYRRIRYPRFEFKCGELFIFLPENFREERNLIEKHKKWLKKHYVFFKKAKETSRYLKLNTFPDEKKFKRMVKEIIENYSDILNVKVKEVNFRKMKNKWGYCTSNGEVVINTNLKFLPEEFTNYICLHEVAHFIERRHTKNFHQIIKKFFPDIEDMEIKLSSYHLLLEKQFLKR